jgi:hypothetical protein
MYKESNVIVDMLTDVLVSCVHRMMNFRTG